MAAVTDCRVEPLPNPHGDKSIELHPTWANFVYLVEDAIHLITVTSKEISVPLPWEDEALNEVAWALTNNDYSGKRYESGPLLEPKIVFDDLLEMKKEIISHLSDAHDDQFGESDATKPYANRSKSALLFLTCGSSH